MEILNTQSNTNKKACFCSRRSALVSVCHLLLLALPVIAVFHMGSAVHADVRTPHAAVVSESASPFTPGAVDGRVEAIAIDDDTVFVGGTFTQIQEALDGDIIDQAYLFAYSKSTGAIIRDFDPVLNNEVYALQTTGEGAGIFAGGAFTTLNGEINRKGLVKIDNFGDRVGGFSARPDKRVYSMDRAGSTLYIGGNFENISSQPREFLAAVNTITGEVLPSIDLDFDGVFSTEDITGFPSVDDIEVTADNQLMVVVGNFATINGISRPRLALLEIGEQTLPSTWNTDIFDVTCPSRRFPQYIRGIDISPDDSYFVVATNGFRLRGVPACDSVTRFNIDDLSNTSAQPEWVNYTGGDSVYEVAAADHVIYAGGHFEFLNNDRGEGNNRGPGGIARNGLAALDPLNGLPLLDWRSDRNPRGVGTFSLEVQPEGLYIGDDTDFLNDKEHPKLKFLPVTTNMIPRPGVPSLPTTILRANNNTLEGSSFDGTQVGVTALISDTNWETVRGAVFLGGQLFHADDDGTLWASSRDADTESISFGSRLQVDLLGLDLDESEVGPDDDINLNRLNRMDFQPWQLDQLTGMFFDHEQGRIYYTLENDSRLLWRAFTPSGPLFGDTENAAEDQGDILWSDVRGMDVIDGHLYFGRTDGRLYRTDINGASPVSGTTQVISGLDIDGNDWNHPFLAFSSEENTLVTPGDAEFEFEFVASSESRSFREFEFPITAGSPINVRLTWDDPNAQLNVFLRDPDGLLLDSDTNQGGSSPKWLSIPVAETSGIYTVAVKIRQGSTAYQVSINPEEEPPPPPEPVADYYFETSGSADSNSFQSFEFMVDPGQAVDVRIAWDNPDAQLNVFMRDGNGVLIDSNNEQDASSPKWLSAVAGDGGVYRVSVKIKEGITDYTVSVNPFDEEPPEQPEPLADFEFTSTGSTESGAWQVFKFDVVAGDLIDASVLWDDPSAVVRLFLRDETNASVARDTDGSGSPESVSAVAASTGRWSVAVRIESGSIDYDVLVDVTGIEAAAAN